MRRLFFLFLALPVALSSGRAQTTETPVPFDTAGRILSINPSLATRLGLTAPTWPVTGAFVEARLYKVSDGGFVIVVQRSTGTNDRYALTADQGAALRASFAEATDRVGRVVMEDAASTIAEPARGPFVRDQMLLAGLMYGPALASLTNDESAGTGAYLLSVGTTFFVLTDMAKKRSITKAQNSLATDGALRGWGGLSLGLHALNVELTDDATAMAVLIGGIGGSVVGYQRGKHLTNSEAQAAMTGSTLAAGTAVGLMATILGEDDDDGRAIAGGALAGGIAGYVMGPGYPRRAGYAVTAGDIALVRLGAVLGGLTALTPIADSDIEPRVGAALVTAGWVGGAYLTDRIASKPFNHSESDSRMIYLGALGGALMGVALPVMAKSENVTFIMTMITGGAIGGAVLTQGMMAPPRQGSSSTESGGGNSRGSKLEFSPQGLAMTLAKQPGNHSVLRLRF